MALFVQERFVMGYTRQVFQVFAPNGAGNWKAQVIGNPIGNGWFPVADTDDGNGIFALAPTPPPPGFSLFGDEVDVTFLNNDLIQSAPPAVCPLSVTTMRGVTFAWSGLAAFPGFTFAEIWVSAGPGLSDNLIIALPAELAIVRRNPHFFPAGP